MGAEQNPAARRSLTLPAPLGLILALLGLTLFFVLTMDLRVRVYDEGLILTGANEVAAGAVPHRDFYANYGPANFYVLAGLFKLFGPGFLVARLWDALLRALIVATVFGLLRSRCSRPLAFATTFLVLLLLCLRDYLTPNLPVLLCALVSTWLVASEGGPRRLLAAGALTGLAALYRYDSGFFVMLSHFAGMAVLAFTQPGSEGRFSALVRRVFIYAAGTAAVFLPCAILLLAAGAGPGFFNDIVDYPLHFYAAMRSLPFPLRPSPEMIVYLPFLVPAALIAGLVLAREPLRAFASRARGQFAFLLLFGLLTGALLIKGLVRVSLDHMMMAIVASLILLALLVQKRVDWARPLRLGIGLLAMAASLLVLLCAARVLPFTLRAADRMPIGALLGLGRAPAADGTGPEIANPARATAPATGRAAPGEFAPEALCAADYVAARTRPDERIFVGTMRHDKLFVNMIELYAAAERRPGTHWYHFDPGLQTRADIQGQMIADLARNDVRWVIRDASFDGMAEPNASAVSSGVTLLDDHLARAFRPVATFGPLSVWARNDVPAPSADTGADCVAGKRAASGPRGFAGRLLG